MSSRLNVRIRETRGIAYSIYSQLQFFQDVGTWSVYAGLDEARLGKGQLLLEQELRTIARDGVKAVELKRAQEQLRASKIMSLESLSSRMTLLGKGLMDEGKPEDPYATIDEIRAVTVDELNALASELCQPDAWSRCLVIPQA
jgi:predicted Zn-dependent peptidase